MKSKQSNNKKMPSGFVNLFSSLREQEELFMNWSADMNTPSQDN